MNEFLQGYRPRLLLGWWKLWGSMPVIDWIRAAELFKAGNFRRAVYYYERGIQRNAGNPAVYCAKLDHAYCIYQLGEVLEAEGLLKKLTVSSPLKDAYLLLAQLQLALGKTMEAIATMERALSLFPRDLQVALCYGHIVFESETPAPTMKSVGDFLKTFRDGLSINSPMHVALDAALATYEIYFGDEQFGERLLSRSLASGVAPFEAIMLCAERCMDQGRVTQARDQFERAAKVSPKDPRPYLSLAESYLRDSEEFQPSYAMQLATIACKLSSWQNPKCLEILRQASLVMRDADMVELIDARLRSLSPTGMKEFQQLEVEQPKTVKNLS